jgi:hypothetical protein
VIWTSECRQVSKFLYDLQKTVFQNISERTRSLVPIVNIVYILYSYPRENITASRHFLSPSLHHQHDPTTPHSLSPRIDQNIDTVNNLYMALFACLKYPMWIPSSEVLILVQPTSLRSRKCRVLLFILQSSRDHQYHIFRSDNIYTGLYLT